MSTLNNFYKVTKYLRTILENNGDVSTIVFGRTEDKDLYKKSLYPLAHINPVSAPMNGRTTKFSFEVAVMDQRDLSSSVETDKFEGNDNLIDNLNTCHSIINYLVSTITLQNNVDQIELVSVSDATPILFKENNLLDGWIITITLEMPNKLSVC